MPTLCETVFDSPRLFLAPLVGGTRELPAWRRQRPLAALALLLPLALLVAPRLAQAQSLPHQSLTLSNGFKVYLLEDHSLPQVQVITWYQVGSANEQPGRTGFAHLFEHLMFKGSAHIPDGDLDILLESAGGTSNAFTSSDMTVYYDTAASNFLEDIFWIEGDRLAGLTETLDEKKLDNQRAVVLNERRQSYENRPYGLAPILLREALWPKGHPYHWPVIGYQPDLDAASPEDVVHFFKQYYVPRNAVMVVAGDANFVQVKALAERYLAWIPGGKAAAAPCSPPMTKIDGPIRLTHEDKVQVPQLTLAWRAPAAFSKDEPALTLAARILGGGKSSRLYKRLVYDEKIAASVSASYDGELLGGELDLVVTARPGIDPAKLETALLEEVARLAEAAPKAAELERAQNGHEADFLGQLQESLWRGIQLAWYAVQAGDPDYLSQDLARYRSVSAEQVRAATARYLDPSHRVNLLMTPAKVAPKAASGATPEASKGTTPNASPEAAAVTESSTSSKKEAK